MSISIRPARARRQQAPAPGEPRYEIFPMSGVLESVETLPAGTVVTVTSSPTKGMDQTIKLAEQLAADGLRPVPHIAARQILDETELAAFIQRLGAVDVRDVFVVGGDSGEPAGEFADGLDLLRAMDGLGHPFEHVGVPSYPEGHPLIDENTTWESLEAKQRHATYTVTQMCFDAATVSRFVTEARSRGITLPVLAGVPGVVDAAKLLRMSMRIGIGDSIRFLRGNRSTVSRLLRPRKSREYPVARELAKLVQDGQCDIAGLHVYTFNHVEATARWLERLHFPDPTRR